MPRPKRRPLNAAKTLEPGHSRDDRVSFVGESSRTAGRRKSRLATDDEEGVLYTVKVTHPPRQRKTAFAPIKEEPQEITNGDVDRDEQPQSDETRDRLQQFAAPSQAQEYNITKIKREEESRIGRFCRFFGVDLSGGDNVDSHLYKPTRSLLAYIYWTFSAGFLAVFLTFLAIFIALCLIFAGLLALAGEIQPECIVVSGEPYGSNPATKFGDAFALSWTTFTTVGYGNVYTATGGDYVQAETEQCSGVVFLCTLEAFLGLVYAGMCTAIMFGKVNRIQSHAHLTFANAVCLQYADVGASDFVDDDSDDSDFDEDDEDDNEDAKESPAIAPKAMLRSSALKTTKSLGFREQFKGCPILKFQVVNDFCNKNGGEIIDGFMKAVGMKEKRQEGVISHSQYVRVNLVDFEHPFFGRVWHGVHILDATSPLLTARAKQEIRTNRGSWPERWFKDPTKIRKKLDFQSLVLTVAGVSNVSACTVHAYKRYKFQDIIIGFDFAPLVYEDVTSGKLKVNMNLVNNVLEQRTGYGEDLKSSTKPYDDGKLRRSLTREMTRAQGSTIFRQSNMSGQS